MNNTDHYYIEKVLGILHSNNKEAISQLEQTIMQLHIFVEPKNSPEQESLDKVISFKSAVSLSNPLDPTHCPDAGKAARMTGIWGGPTTTQYEREKYEQDINCR